MPSLLLRESQQVVLNGAGNGQIQIGPQSSGEVWYAQSVSVKTTQAVSTGTCQCNVYVGNGPTESNFRAGTFSGDTGDTTDVLAHEAIRLPNRIYLVWTSGVANDTATV